MVGRKNYLVKLSCPIHGEDVWSPTRNATYFEAKGYTEKCPHCDRDTEVIEVKEDHTR